MDRNRLELSGEIVALEALRHTPAGIPVQLFVVRHVSVQREAGMKRQVECEIPVVAMAEMAERAARLKIGDAVSVSGFLARRSLKNGRLELHLTRLDILEHSLER
ncbi:MAG: primosomal replication protein N [Methylophilaceae bacterium]|nr:primosomal replication protein N [Methylophilaceae bacterium]